MSNDNPSRRQPWALLPAADRPMAFEISSKGGEVTIKLLYPFATREPQRRSVYGVVQVCVGVNSGRLFEITLPRMLLDADPKAPRVLETLRDFFDAREQNEERAGPRAYYGLLKHQFGVDESEDATPPAWLFDGLRRIRERTSNNPSH